jgi:hypothetical protein
MMSLKRLLQVAERLLGRKALDRIDTSPVHLHREHQTRTGRDAVDMHGARTAHAVFAADVGTRRAEFVPDEIRQQFARLAVAASFATVEGQRDPPLFALPHEIH